MSASQQETVEIFFTTESRDPDLSNPELVAEIEAASDSLLQTLKSEGYPVTSVTVQRETAFPGLLEALLIKFALGLAGGSGAYAGKNLTERIHRWLKERWTDSRILPKEENDLKEQDSKKP